MPLLLFYHKDGGDPPIPRRVATRYKIDRDYQAYDFERNCLNVNIEAIRLGIRSRESAKVGQYFATVFYSGTKQVSVTVFKKAMETSWSYHEEFCSLYCDKSDLAEVFKCAQIIADCLNEGKSIPEFSARFEYDWLGKKKIKHGKTNNKTNA